MPVTRLSTGAKGTWYPQLDGLNLPRPLTDAIQQIYSLVYSLRDTIARLATTQTVTVAQIDVSMQFANIASTLFYAVPANAGGMYRASFYIVLTRAGSTAATIPYGVIGYTDQDLNVATQVAPIGDPTNSTNNTVGGNNNHNGYADVASFNVKAGTSISYSTSN